MLTESISLVSGAVLLPRLGNPVEGADRSLQAAVQNINGMNSILALLPVLTGKVQNVKMIASRIYPASLNLAGIGAGRVLSKLQIGLLLCSFNLYRNTVSEVSYPHDEYVNKFAPVQQHVPTATPERHSSGKIINHNLSETYLVEAWFRAQGRPSTIELMQNNYVRMAVGFTIYLIVYAAETYLGVQNAAIGTQLAFVIFQMVCVVMWLSAITILQVRRGQGSRFVKVNSLDSSEYRCHTLPMLGDHVSSSILSFHLENVRKFNLFGGDYQQTALTLAGLLILLNAVLDIVSTVLIVGLTNWAYPWLALEVFIIAVKVFFCIEPLRTI